MSDERLIYKLADHLWSLQGIGHSACERQAVSILADRQAHIDALVEVGVLRSWRTTSFIVVLPKPTHEHEWRWSQLFIEKVAQVGYPVAVVDCGCGERRRIVRPKDLYCCHGALYSGGDADTGLVLPNLFPPS